MKGGSDKQGRGRLPPLLQLESSPLFRRLSVVVACFFFVLVFFYYSGHDGAVINILGPKTSLRTPAAAETLRSSASHGIEVSRDVTAAAVGTANGVVAEAEAAESNAAAGASTPSSDDDRRAAARDDIPETHERQFDPPRVVTGAAAEEPPVQDNAVHVTAAATAAAQPAMDNTASPPGDTGIMARADSSVVDGPLCDLSGFRADVCDLAGDVRLDAKASTFFVVVDDDRAAAAGDANGIRPYPRKNDKTAMARVTELTVRRATAEAAPMCSATHAAPAVAFSVGGYAGNIFHDFSDVIVPLYGAARRYQGEVQLVVADAASGRWLARYGALLAGLSRHAPLDLSAAARAGEVHCFGRAVVGLQGARELLIEPGQGPDGTSMPDLSLFLRAALALPRAAPTRPGYGTKPRLLIISRARTRRLLNVDAATRAAEEAGFEVVVTELGPGDDVTQVGRLFNSFDAVVGVHGAALTNMVFLPPGAALVQVVPWGGLRWIARLDFGDPAEAMGLRYVQYEVGVEESTLKDKYPRDHEIFTNPTALHKLGFKFLRQTLLNGQDIVLDLERFRAVLRQVLNDLAQ